MHSAHKTILAAVLAAFAVVPAMAGNGNGNGNGHGKHGGKHADKHHVVDDHGRHARHDDDRGRHGDRYGYDRDGHRGCPPGLAKKHNGCMPPGQAKKVAVGHRVPPHAVYTIPRHVRSQLPPARSGYRYAMVNDQVVLVGRNDLVVNIVLNLRG